MWKLQLAAKFSPGQQVANTPFLLASAKSLAALVSAVYDPWPWSEEQSSEQPLPCYAEQGIAYNHIYIYIYTHTKI